MAGEQQAVEQPAGEALSQLPQRRPASLYDVAVQYSILDWYITVSSGELDFDLDPEHLAFMTPRAKDDLYSEEDNAIVVHADLSDKENPTLRDENPVTIETVTEEQRFQLGHSYPANKTSSMTDYSVTTHKNADAHHLSGKRDDAWGTANVQDRFNRWAQSEAAQAVVERGDVEDTWIIEALAQLGDDEDEMETVQDAFLQLVDYDEERELEAFVTIRVKLPEEDEYRWPGEIPALNGVMVEQKGERFENMSVDDAAGDGVGYVTGDESRVTGGSAGVLGMFAKKQREHFANISPDGSEAWRARPVSRETAAALATANSVFEEFYQPLGEGRRLYVLPHLAVHPERVSPDEFAWFVDSVFGSLRQRDDNFQTAVESLFFEPEQDSDEVEGLFADPDERRNEWVGIATSFVVTGNPDRVFFERLDTDQYRPLEVDLNHSEILQTPQFDTTGVFADTVVQSESALLTPDAPRAGMLLFGYYFERTTEPTRSSREAQDTPKAGDIDDVRARRLRQLLTDEPLAYETLLEEYLHRLVQNQRNRFDEDQHGVPANETVEQYVQLRALSESGALERSRPSASAVSSTADGTLPTIATVTTQHQSAEFESRGERLSEFIESHEILNESESHQAVFLLGGLVGRITAYQRVNNVSSTLVRRYPIDYLTKQSIKEVTNEVMQMNNTYVESDDELPPTYNARYIDKLPDLMLKSDPTTWQFTQNELQWLYALGIAYGSNDTSIQTEES